MIHLGDITKIDGRKVPFVNRITFGSPCQDLSVAGKRAGLAGERSGLFMVAVKIIKEMREVSGGIYPTFVVWENVLGAFSSNGGEDFRAVLEELARIKEPGISVPRPANGKWAKAGIICGDGWSVAWRTFDAQYWGVPQRRRRIAVVLDLGGQRAGEILFERQGVSGNLGPSIPPWKGIARNPAHCAAGHDRVVEGAGAYTLKIRSGCEGGGKGPLVQTGKSATLSTLQDQTLFAAIPINDKATRWMGGGKSRNHDGSGNGLGVGDRTDPMFTRTAGDRHAVCCIGVDGYNGCETGDKSITIRAGRSDQDHVGCVAIPINTQIATRHISLGERTGMGWGEDGDPAYTLQAGHEHAVLCAAFTAGQGAKANGIGYAEEQAPTLRTDGGLSAMPTVLCRAHGQANAETAEKYAPAIAHALLARANCSFREDSETFVAEKRLRWIVRRLTPTECERLQGFPDGWTDICEFTDRHGVTHAMRGWLDDKGRWHKSADSPRYKALGNSIALPQWWWITCKMAAYLPERATLGSLFDGIGGFPLVWETRHGKGTALWASEIEPFPIAVTKERFK